MGSSCANHNKQFLVLSPSQEICARNQLNGTENTIFLREGEILLNPGDLFKFNDEEECEIKYIREISRIHKNIVFDDAEVIEGCKVIFNARVIKNIEFKVTNNPICSQFTGWIGFKVVEIPFAGYVEVKGAGIGDKVELCGFIDGELDRPEVGKPFIAVNEIGGTDEPRLVNKLPGAVLLVEKTIVKVLGEVVGKRECHR